MNRRIGNVLPVPAGPETRISRGNVPVCARRFSLTSIRSSLGSVVHVRDFDARLFVAVFTGHDDLLDWTFGAIEKFTEESIVTLQSRFEPDVCQSLVSFMLGN